MWTPENRGRYDRSRLRYPSDLTEAEWGLVLPLIPPAKRGGNRRHVEVERASLPTWGAQPPAPKRHLASIGRICSSACSTALQAAKSFRRASAACARSTARSRMLLIAACC